MCTHMTDVFNGGALESGLIAIRPARDPTDTIMRRMPPCLIFPAMWPMPWRFAGVPAITSGPRSALFFHKSKAENAARKYRAQLRYNVTLKEAGGPSNQQNSRLVFEV